MNTFLKPPLKDPEPALQKGENQLAAKQDLEEVLQSVLSPEPAVIRKSFAHGLNFYKLFWIFFIGCFLGVVIETIWCLVTRGYFESRQGLIYGPFNLVYGIGALAMTLGLNWLSKKRDLWIFAGGFVIGSIFEFICSWVQEVVFGSISWNYENMPLNLAGRINVLYSMFWGILALLWVKNIFPLMTRWIERIPNKVGVPLTWVLVVFMILNSQISAVAVGRWSDRVTYHTPPANSVEAFLDKTYPDNLMQRIYPNMEFTQIEE